VAVRAHVTEQALRRLGRVDGICYATWAGRQQLLIHGPNQGPEPTIYQG